MLIYRRLLFLGVSVAVGAWALCNGNGASIADDSKQETEVSEDAPKKPEGLKRAGSGDPKRDKMVKTVGRQLGRMSPGSGKKKDANDFFVLGIAEMNLVTREADVQFQSVQGQKEAAEFVADYMLNSPEGSLRQWHVFARAKDSSQADEILQQTRSQFDQQREYRERISAMYNAKTVRRG